MAGNGAVRDDGATMLTVDQVAARWRVDRKTVYGMVSRGELAARRLGRVIRIPLAAVEAFEAA